MSFTDDEIKAREVFRGLDDNKTLCTVCDNLAGYWTVDPDEWQEYQGAYIGTAFEARPSLPVFPRIYGFCSSACAEKHFKKST